ncbi:hypothetical protein AKO1_014914, partial [Acrasis kona]
MAVPVFQTSVILGQSVSYLWKESTVALYDLNATDFDSSFMFNTGQYGDSSNGTYVTLHDMTARENYENYILPSPFLVNYTIMFADRVWIICFIPTQFTINKHSNSIDPYVGIMCGCVIWFLSIFGCIILYIFGNMMRVSKDRRKAEKKIKILMRLLPEDFLRFINQDISKAAVAKEGVRSSFVFMSIVLNNFELTNSTIVTIQEFFVRVKYVIKSYNGTVYRCDGVDLVCFFEDETCAMRAAMDIHDEMEGFESVHINMHHCSAVLGLVGDSESLLPILFSDQLVILGKLSLVRHSRQDMKIVISKPVYDLLFLTKKYNNQQVSFVGRLSYDDIHDTSAHIDAYHVNLGDKPDKKYGAAIRKIMLREYTKGLVLLNSFIDSTGCDDKQLLRTQHVMKRRMSMCEIISNTWNFYDTIDDHLAIRPAFAEFCRREGCLNEFKAWTELSECRKAEKAFQIINDFCDPSSVNRIRSSVVTLVDNLKTSRTQPRDVVEDVLSTIYYVIGPIHNKFKTSPAFTNAMYSSLLDYCQMKEIF